MRAEINPAERLALTLRYLATGNSQVSEKLTRYGNRFIMMHIYRFHCHSTTVLEEVQCVKY